jgi:hypothetical protein
MTPERVMAVEARDHLGAMGTREPVREIENDTREEPRLGDPQKEPENVERRLAPDEHRARGDEPPEDHDARDPDPGPHPLEDEVRGDLEQEVADEEHAGADSIHGIAEAEILLHLELREPDVHPIEVREDVAEEERGKKAPGDLSVGRLLERRHRLRLVLHRRRNAAPKTAMTSPHQRFTFHPCERA